MSRASTILEQLEICSGLRVSINPSRFERVINDLQLSTNPTNNLRMLGSLESCDVFVWDANRETHKEAAAKIGVDFEKCVRGWAENRSGKDWEVLKKATGWTPEFETTVWRGLVDHPNYQYVVSKMKKVFQS